VFVITWTRRHRRRRSLRGLWSSTSVARDNFCF